MRKIYLRLLPFAVISYLLAYIDRINASFAALTMRGDLKVSAAEYGFAVGTFYWGYFMCEVPSNVVLEKVGARLWIARIMITWGIFAGLTALVADFGVWTGFSNTVSLSITRFLLRARRGRVCPRYRALFHLLVPELSPRADRLRLPCRPADRGGRGRADIDRAT